MAETTGNSQYVTEAELDDALPHILKAPQNHASIDVLCHRPDFGARVFPEKLTLCPEKGVIGDRWFEHAWLRCEDGAPDPRIQICLLGRRVLDVVRIDHKAQPHPGDTIITDMNFAEDHLPVGTHLKIGEAVIEVSDVFNDACTKWKARYGAASRQWINRPEHVPLRLRGVFCQIIEGGEITLNSTLEKI